MSLLSKDDLRKAIKIIEKVEEEEFLKAYAVWKNYERNISPNKENNTIPYLADLYLRFKSFEKLLMEFPDFKKISIESAQIIHAYLLKILNLQILAQENIQMEEKSHPMMRQAKNREEDLNELIRLSVTIQDDKYKNICAKIACGLGGIFCISTYWLAVALPSGCVCSAMGGVCCCSQSTDGSIEKYKNLLEKLNDENPVVNQRQVFRSPIGHSNTLVIGSDPQTPQSQEEVELEPLLQVSHCRVTL